MVHTSPRAVALSSLEPSPAPRGLFDNFSSSAALCTEEGCFPRLFIIGTQKGATTSLYRALEGQAKDDNGACGAKMMKSWPDVNTAISEKEAHVFDMRERCWKMLMEKPSLYPGLYKSQHCKSHNFLDATPRYIRNPIAAPRIPLMMPGHWLPKLRMVLSIREPIARDLSWFNHKLSAALVALSPEKTAHHVPTLQNDSFCSLKPSERKNSLGLYEGGLIPHYAAEVLCRKKEIDECLLQAQQRLDQGARVPVDEDEANLLHRSRANVRPYPDSEEGVGDQELRDAWMLDQYDECAGNIWQDWDQTASSNSQGSSNVTEWEGGDPPVLSWGFYLPQIRAWTQRAGVSRSQLLVLDFDRMVTRPDDILPRVTDFMGLPRLKDNSLPHKNAAGECAGLSCGKVRLAKQLIAHRGPDLTPCASPRHRWTS